ncbi:hypothetical protein I302_103991 [Kwoniella bestiolae CBS 10118]|uniref:NmrA-like domain-containing protein n=1 Tax=Kwoniella bestiolae CBS 10118 TaxID=1296100 RepID=A0AAJ8M891_9TREE
MSRTVLITGATGQQGGATLKSLIKYITSSEDGSFKILALTRDRSSDKAKALQAIPGVEVVEGDLSEGASIDKLFETHEIDSVFSVQDIFQGNEVQQGKSLVDVAARYGVKHFVYTSVDMSGLNPSPVTHFETKRQIEQHLISHEQMVHTILRPSAFYSNFYWPPYRLSMGTKWNPEKPFKHVAVSDIGRAAAEILFSGGHDERFRNKIINLTGDSHRPDEIRKIFKDVKNVVWEDPEEEVDIGTELTNALRTINVHPFEGTPEESRNLFPWVKDLKSWLETEYQEKVIAGQLGSD